MKIQLFIEYYENKEENFFECDFNCPFLNEYNGKCTLFNDNVTEIIHYDKIDGYKTCSKCTKYIYKNK